MIQLISAETLIVQQTRVTPLMLSPGSLSPPEEDSEKPEVGLIAPETTLLQKSGVHLTLGVTYSAILN